MSDPRAAPIVVDEFPPAMRSLRLAMVTETYPPEVNGVSLTLQRLVEGLRARNHDIQLVRPRQQADAASGGVIDGGGDVLMRGVPIPRYPHLRMGVLSKRSLVELWTRRRPDVVHIATEGPLGWSALQAATTMRLPVCSDFRTNFHAYLRHYGMGLLTKPMLAYLRKFHNRTLCTMVPTESLRVELAALGFQNLRVVERGVDARCFSPAHRSDELRRSWGAAPHTLVLLCVGRLAAEKNLSVVLATYEALQRRGSACQLVLVGDGPMRAELQDRCPTAVFAGVQHGDALAAHYASADLFLFPSVTETFGNVTPEAMASGLPVLAFDLAAAGQLITDGVDGALVPPPDTQGFVERALAMAHDRAALAAIGNRARETALGLDWARIVLQLESVLMAARLQTPSTHLTPALARGAGA